eukprot:1961481-Pyramimonas_sp.AAC.1
MSTAFFNGAGKAQRLTRPQALQANIMSTQRTQPYEMADDEMWKWQRVWTCHDTQRMQLPSTHVQWPAS